MSVDVSIVIINYNCGDYLADCIKSIYEKTNGPSFEIIVVDNDSSDNSVSNIRKEFPEVMVIENGKNLGFGAANNIGAQNASGTYLLLLNPDTILINNAVDCFHKFAQENTLNVGCLGGNLLDENMEDANIGGNFPSMFQLFSDIGFRLFYKKYYNQKVSLMMTVSNLPDTNEIDCVCGADLFIEKNVFNKVGGFDEDYFLYFEDTDLCYRLKKLGLKCIIVPNARIQHLESVSITDNRSEKLNLKKFTFFENGKQLFFEKAYNSGAKYLAKFFTLAYLFTRFIAHRGNFKSFLKMGIVVINSNYK